MYRTMLCILFVCVFSSCSRKNDADLYHEGTIAEEQKNFQLAIERYDEIVQHDPHTAYAETSQYRIAVIYNNDLRDPVKALKAYQAFHAMFPLSTQAPNALFLTGFLYNNELRMIDSARKAYETFLAQYPTHELAASAKFELETLGKDPGDIVQSRQLAPAENEKQDGKKKGAK